MATRSCIPLISGIYLLIFYNETNAITGYTRRPLNGYYCNTGQYKDMGRLDQLTCTRSCIMSDTCILLMYTPITNTCLHLHGVPPCPRAIPHPDIMIMRFRPSLQEQCLIPSHLSDNRLVRTDSGISRLLARKYKDGVVCMGLLPDTQNCGCACAGNAGNVFPVTAGKRSRHASRHVRHARAVMHAGIAI